MAKRVKVRLNSRNLQSQILYGEGVGTEGALLAPAAGAQANPDLIVTTERSSNARGGGRLRVRVYGDMADEARNGTLSRVLK